LSRESEEYSQDNGNHLFEVGIADWQFLDMQIWNRLMEEG
jgi:hypothetical protein